MDTLVENEFLHKLRTYLHLEESTEYRNKLGRICVKIGMIQIPYKHHRKSTHVVIRLKDKKCGIFKNVSMTFMDLNSLDAFETEDSVLYKL